MGMYTTTMIMIWYIYLDGPFFKEGNPNSTLITEHESDTDVNITCTVKSSVPPVDKLTIEPSKGDNWKTVKSTNDSVTVVITKANAKNTRNFTCSAMNNITTSTLTFNNFIGGKPYYVYKTYINMHSVLYLLSEYPYLPYAIAHT